MLGLIDSRAISSLINESMVPALKLKGVKFQDSSSIAVERDNRQVKLPYKTVVCINIGSRSCVETCHVMPYQMILGISELKTLKISFDFPT